MRFVASPIWELGGVSVVVDSGVNFALPVAKRSKNIECWGIVKHAAITRPRLAQNTKARSFQHMERWRESGSLSAGNVTTNYHNCGYIAILHKIM